MANRLAHSAGAILAALMLGGPERTAAAAETIYLPCAAFAPGNSWRYSEKSSHGSSISTSTVSFVQVNDISINERKTLSPLVHEGGRSTLPDVDQRIRRKLVRAGDTVYLAGYTMELKAAGTLESRTSIAPGAGAPECGELPATTQYDQTTFLHGDTTRQRVRVLTTLVGPARVVVPAGSFDTIAVRRIYTTTHVAGGAAYAQSSTLRVEMVIYAAEEVGVVRTETKTELESSRSSGTTELLSYRVR